jgi:hypothetical protein
MILSNERPSRSQHRQPVMLGTGPVRSRLSEIDEKHNDGQTEASIAGSREPVRSRLSEIDEKRPKQRAA